MNRTRRVIDHKKASLKEAEQLQLASAQASEELWLVSGRTVWGGVYAKTESSGCEAHCKYCKYWSGLRLIRGDFVCASCLFRVTL